MHFISTRELLSHFFILSRQPLSFHFRPVFRNLLKIWINKSQLTLTSLACSISNFSPRSFKTTSYLLFTLWLWVVNLTWFLWPWPQGGKPAATSGPEQEHAEGSWESLVEFHTHHSFKQIHIKRENFKSELRFSAFQQKLKGTWLLGFGAFAKSLISAVPLDKLYFGQSWRVLHNNIFLPNNKVWGQAVTPTSTDVIKLPVL